MEDEVNVGFVFLYIYIHIWGGDFTIVSHQSGKIREGT